MTSEEIEAQLSYAYLHAVASQAGIACQEANRTHDNLGIDAMLTLRKDFGPGAVLTDITLHLQLKATTRSPSEGERTRKNRLSYFLRDMKEYDRLRAQSSIPRRFLGVLFLPEEPARWLTHSAEQLIMCRCAYWVSLMGAPASNNESGQTVYLPESQPLSPEGLLSLFSRIACEEVIGYES